MGMRQAVVCNGKIEIQAPFECKEGQVVSIILLNHSSLSDPLSGDEKENALRVLEEFTSTFSINPSQEDLSDLVNCRRGIPTASNFWLPRGQENAT